MNTGSNYDADQLLLRFNVRDGRNRRMLDLISRVIDDNQWNALAHEHLKTATKYLDQVDWSSGHEERCFNLMDRAYIELEFALQMSRPDLFSLVSDGNSVSIKRTIH
ncbi:MAG TPA: hypothetical protein V6C81_26965 [Planktothrix sp.]|jgi:hypothetical protein